MVIGARIVRAVVAANHPARTRCDSVTRKRPSSSLPILIGRTVHISQPTGLALNQPNQMQNNSTQPPAVPAVGLAGDACYALLWIHTHHQTGEPLQIDVTEWNGRVDVLEELTDDAKISDLDLTGLKREDWIHVRVEYSWEETEYSLRLFPHNNQAQPRAGE